jgi:hypothetical protein
MVQSQILYENTFTHSTFPNVKEDKHPYSGKKHAPIEGERIRLLKRIPLERLMDLKIDYAFKQIFA